MGNYKWKYVGTTPYATVLVDYNRRMTKMVGKVYIYYHEGIYPNHNSAYTKKYSKKIKAGNF